MKHAIFFIAILLSPVYADIANRLNPVTSARLGDPVTLKCVFLNDDYNDHLQWYKQNLGAHPDLIVTTHQYLKTPIYSPGYNGSHFRLHAKEPVFSLTIMNTSSADEAMYYCAIVSEATVKFRDGTFLSVTGSHRKMWNDQTILQRPVSDYIYSGKTGTFQCSVLSKTCPGEHSVYWFRAGSGQSRPGIIYTNGNRSEECEKNLETSSSTQSCTYRLPIKKFSSSDAGTYYCAVAICGEILFGKGTKLDGLSEWNQSALIVGVISMAVGLVVCIVVIIILIRDRNTKSSSGTVSSSQRARRQGVWREECNTKEQDAETLNYAALHFSELKGTRGRRKDGPPKESVYSSVKV